MAQYYDFFLSFSSIDWRKGKKDDIEQFFRAVEDKLRSVGRLDGGFFSPDSISRGHLWAPELAQALSASRVLVPVYSPNYFQSVYCGKEWQVFWERYEENQRNPPRDVTSPETILPVLWTTDLLNFPEGVPKVQHAEKSPDPEIYWKKGLGYMMQSPRKYGQQYAEFVDRFGTELARMAAGQGGAKMRPITPLADLAPPFPPGFKPGLTHVRYLFLAGRKDEMSSVRKELDCYGIYEDRQDWRPCYPDINRQAGEIATSVAAESRKAYEFVKPGEKLIEVLNEAKALKNIVIVIVDPWSLKLNSFRQFVEAFDAEEFPNAGVVVAWNKKDQETSETLPLLKQTIEDNYFHGRRQRKEFQSDMVTSPEELRLALLGAFNAVREKLMERGEIRSAEGAENSPVRPVLKV